MISQAEVEKIVVNEFKDCMLPLREISRDFQFRVRTVSPVAFSQLLELDKIEEWQT